ncbi:FAD binding domain-containing protein [Colletotrichum truncatum]|uniref:FAD binding domain-containing protein n=1 Tax=Colletotrichum truncatum TaxID=5467 RepID=A0ACC3YNI8_COLTU|nr:FAD binding domain-containing protein [Colletotrichum truncatum]KAF6789450.1 FAD binding domain-containing protein [Colletotrichum truncatum]
MRPQLDMASHFFCSATLAVVALSGLASANPQVGIRQTNVTLGRGCAALTQAGLAAQLYFADDSEYASTLNSYYDGAIQRVTPRCIFKPETTEQVSAGLKALSAEGGNCWTVAIRSGGHSPAPNNNAQNGVTIDLERLNTVTYSEDAGTEKGHGIASIGSGARWGNVYTELEKLGVMVTGGREGHVGVGGFLLGGGFAWQSGKHGLACDNVVSYEVVLANGTVVTATSTSHHDLWRSLKGGLNNLGLVTRFDLQAFPSQNAYGGIVAFPYNQAEPVLEKFTTMVQRNEQVPAEHGFVSLTWSPATGPSVAFVLANVDGVENSTSFVGLEDLTPIVDTRSHTPISGLVTQLQGKLGLYNVWFTMTFYASMSMARKVIEVFDDLIAGVKDTLNESDQVIFLLTPLPTNYAGNGENVLDLNGNLYENSMVLQAEALLSTPEHKQLITDKLQYAVESTLSAWAANTHQRFRWKYLNYANPLQDVWWTIGSDRFLLNRTAQAYDPTGFFQTRVSGGFKISDSD